jgi:hypothetical protein
VRTQWALTPSRRHDRAVASPAVVAAHNGVFSRREPLGQIWPGGSAGCLSAGHGHGTAMRVPALTWASDGFLCRCGAFIRAALGMRMLPEARTAACGSAEYARERGVAMPWFPDFASAVELARRQTRAAGQADPVTQYFTALNKGDTHRWAARSPRAGWRGGRVPAGAMQVAVQA